MQGTHLETCVLRGNMLSSRICIQHGIDRRVSNLAWTYVQIELKKPLPPALVDNRAYIWRHYVRVTVPDRGSEEGNRNWLCWCMKCLQSGRKLQGPSFLSASPIFRVICFLLLTSNPPPPHLVDFSGVRTCQELESFSQPTNFLPHSSAICIFEVIIKLRNWVVFSFFQNYSWCIRCFRYTRLKTLN